MRGVAPPSCSGRGSAWIEGKVACCTSAGIDGGRGGGDEALSKVLRCIFSVEERDGLSVIVTCDKTTTLERRIRQLEGNV